MEDTKCKSCRECVWASFTNSPMKYYSPYRCMHNGDGRMITSDEMCRGGGLKPLWCPLGRSTGKKVLTYSEKTAIWEKMPPKVEFADFEIGAVYHLPPYHYNTERYDVRIIGKSSTTLTYKKIVNNVEGDYAHTTYQSSPLWRHLVKKRSL